MSHDLEITLQFDLRALWGLLVIPRVTLTMTTASLELQIP